MNGKQYNNDGICEFNLKNACGKIKEYDYKGRIKFESEYLNGERWKGKEYKNNGQLIFEGDFLKKTGKIKEFDSLGLLQFEGEYLNGEIWNGKKYNDDGVFELELKKGFGIEYSKNGKIKF